ncbi:MAG: hypothetical protein ACREBR_02235 [bacterium]
MAPTFSKFDHSSSYQGQRILQPPPISFEIEQNEEAKDDKEEYVSIEVRSNPLSASSTKLKKKLRYLNPER